MKKHLIIFIFAALVFSSCRKQVSDYERPGFDPQPTLNAVLQEGQPVWAQVTFAQGLDSVRPSACTNAEVLLYVDGQFAERLQHDGDGLYGRRSWLRHALCPNRDAGEAHGDWGRNYGKRHS